MHQWGEGRGLLCHLRVEELQVGELHQQREALDVPGHLRVAEQHVRALLWYKKPPTGSYAYHRNLNLDFDGAWSC